ncbi:MAG: hypothetical protein EOM03_15575 [Clostridia bacterium]|nr:hypothetical protein [Clostridia bacterium]
MKPRFKAEDRVILVGNRKLWGTPGIDVSSSMYHTIPPGTPGTVDKTNTTIPFVRFDGFEGRHCLRQKWLVPESPSDEDIFEVLPGCDTTPLEDDATANLSLHPAMLVHFIKPACLFTGQWWVLARNTGSKRVVGPKWLRLVETEETKEKTDMNKIRLITHKWLERHGACKEGLDFFDTTTVSDTLPEYDVPTKLSGHPEYSSWTDWLNSRLDRYGHELETVNIEGLVTLQESGTDVRAGHQYTIVRGPDHRGCPGLCFLDNRGDKRLLRLFKFSIPEETEEIKETEETAPTIELWAVSPGVEIPRSIFGYNFRCSHPTLLRVTVTAGGKRTFDRCFDFGAGSVSWHTPNDHVHLVGINCREALEPYLPKVTQLTRAEVAEKLGIDNLEIVD